MSDLYSYNDWRNYQELYHHGILGMKWGVHNGPPYPLSAEDHNASEKKAGWQDSLKATMQKHRVAADKKDLASRIKKGYKRESIWRDKNVVEQCKPEIDAIRKNPKYKKALSEYKKYSDDFDGYINDERLTTKYQTLAGIIAAKRYDSDSNMMGIGDWVYGYVFEDADQGEGNSYSIYKLDQGVDVKQYNKQVSESYTNLINTRRELVKETLGDHASDVIVPRNPNKPYSRNITTGLVLDSAINSVEDTWAVNVEIDDRDIKWYKNALSEAKKDYDKYKLK